MDCSELKISVIVPIYNAEDSILKCINSIKAQTHKNLQIILIDDGSTDRSLEICKSSVRDDTRIEVYHKKNEGSVVARKYGLGFAEGDFIGFVDADDYVDPQMFSELLQVLYDSGADFVHSGYVEEKYEDKKEKCNFVLQIVDTINTQTKADFLIQNILEGNGKQGISYSLWSKLFKGSLIKKCFGFLANEQQYGEDLICLCRCVLESQRIMLYPKSMYHYTVKNKSLSHLNPEEYMLQEVGLWYHILEVFKEYQYYDILKLSMCHFIRNRMLCSVSVNRSSKPQITKYYFKGINKIFEKKVILFGAGNVGQDYYTQIRKYSKCNIVAWVDSNWTKYQFEYADVISLEEAIKLPFDYVIIAIEKKEMRMEIKNLLLGIGIHARKIINQSPEKYFG